MQTLCEQRQEIYKNPDLPICSSLALYVLAELRPRPDNPNHFVLGCTEVNDVEGIGLFVSPVDAVIRCRVFNSEGGKFEVFPFESIDPRRFIRDHDGWLTLYIAYGFAAHGNKLVLRENGYPSGLIYTTHSKFSLEDIKEHIHFEFGKSVTNWLDRVHRAVGVPEYPSLVYEQAQSPMAELELLASTALRVAEYTEPDEHKPMQCALFDPVEAQWRFADYDTI
jgi:hypothetical protein